MTVNPKKLRPYDEPPKRRRRWIPDAPNSAATGFLVAAAAWVAIGTAIGLLAIGLRTFSGATLAFPLGVFDLEFTLDATRAQHAFVNAIAYGWLSNAGFAAICFLTPRLLGRPLAMEKAANAALGLWNLSVAGGIASVYVFDLGAHGPYTSFPWLIDGGMLLALVIVTGAFLRTTGAGIRSAYISTWYAAVALLAFTALTAANAAINFVELPELTTALASAYLGRAVEAFWLLGMAVATLYYVVPRTTGGPLYSSAVAMLGWLAWLVMAPLSGLAMMLDTSVPYVITTIGGVATILLLVPALLVVMNLLLTMRGRWTALFGTGSAAFAAVALAFLLATALLQAIGALRSVQAVVGGTEWEAGAFVFAALGAYTFAAFALAEHALPRLLRREWGGGILSGAQLWAGFGGAALAGVALMGGGLAEGSLIGQGATAEALAAGLLPYRLTAAAGIGLVALGGLAMVVNLFLMYTSGEPAEYAVPGQPATATAGGH
ncbi:MAG: cbb3-type cytochrome c oxidase subunit I [Candidatus Limnocylindria bacterium]